MKRFREGIRTDERQREAAVGHVENAVGHLPDLCGTQLQAAQRVQGHAVRACRDARPAAHDQPMQDPVDGAECHDALFLLSERYNV